MPIAPHSSRFQFPGRRPRRRRAVTYIPRHYEPHYAYPLLVLFHGRGGDELQLTKIMPRISNRNYVAVGLRGPQATRSRRDGSMGYAWSQTTRGSETGEGVATLAEPRMPNLSHASSEFLAEYVMDTVAEVRDALNIHDERVFLVGYGEGAAAAYKLGLSMPQFFAGIVAVNGWLPKTHGPLIWLPEARRLRVLIAHGRDNQLVPVSAAEHAHRVLYSAGIDTSFELLDTGHRIQTQLLRIVNDWIMHSVSSAAIRGERAPVA